ncbi:nucleotide-binding universal stress UspA family protein [Parabacteroides sp. PF5-5]|uniref:universal stress protein n=1 Tax=unclassified Parabacteroides TaxID=2649774 RepID=UPI0024749989|nr:MULTISPECIES: universal stress protein [unclassified Parabacteroides]MDH6303820.1 nucleotide-binding universal stress UspA family protein [Parabacteroides sp. PH5-39]MDH6314437.1 nucleotide-binding universal stress UspA family protein [Parabacteroides sp. PF5-13]MDH6318498.1 nucleotide-binding universal stress UspA family protein [Parabacteroides sp. PH5-13]MDH6322209.1 nucleotide-binding universal stress UspA family protein [Parabacteroides sp. PH5-8]MDH6325711.1 nucleotide-binding univers
MENKEEKLVTLAIHTFEKAQILKTILETEGIEVYIHNVNQIQPVVSAGVRVRIKESDLPHALRIIEDSKWLEETHEEITSNREKKVLIPIDFSDYSMKACDFGINYAHKIGAEVMILHAYFSPYFPTAIPFGDTLAYQVNEEDSVQNILKRVKTDMENICTMINRKMKSGELPEVKYDYTLREGLPEEEILSYSKEYHPTLIVMGTRGKNQKDMDLIGSVTGEIIEINKVPVLAIPENVPFEDLRKAKQIAFATSFNQRDLVAFDTFMDLMKGFDIKIHLFNISTSKDEWNEIRLSGIKDYFAKQYPKADIAYTVLDDGDLLLSIEKFVRDKQIDLIALTTHRRNILARMFNPGIARKMLFHTDTPLLVLHS